MKIRENINIDSIVMRHEDIDATDLDGEKVMMDLEKGKYFALNEVGSRIWDIIDKPVSVRDIIGILLKEYDIDEKSCNEEVINFIGKMNDAGIIEIK
jgi:hypothetical protein